jgi:hypothetical protein
MNGKVLDIKGGKATAGSEVIMWIHKSDNSPNQQWYIDHEGFIRSCLNDFALECKAQGDKFKMAPWRGDPRQQWVIQGNRIVNRAVPMECLDIERESTKDGANVIAWKYKGSANQHWRFQYV